MEAIFSIKESSLFKLYSFMEFFNFYFFCPLIHLLDLSQGRLKKENLFLLNIFERISIEIIKVRFKNCIFKQFF